MPLETRPTRQLDDNQRADIQQQLEQKSDNIWVAPRIDPSERETQPDPRPPTLEERLAATAGKCIAERALAATSDSPDPKTLQTRLRRLGGSFNRPVAYAKKSAVTEGWITDRLGRVEIIGAATIAPRPTTGNPNGPDDSPWNYEFGAGSGRLPDGRLVNDMAVFPDGSSIELARPDGAGRRRWIAHPPKQHLDLAPDDPGPSARPVESFTLAATASEYGPRP
ncbi:MAG: hypothetical protein OXH53_11030 [bacterium]|nr:hypothetical protein [bacterium]